MEDQNQIHDLIDKYLDENSTSETEHLERLLQNRDSPQSLWELTEIHGRCVKLLTIRPQIKVRRK